MNVGMIARAVRRHLHMKDAPAYEELLQQARNHGDVWMAPQGDVAAWWERRQNGALVLTAREGHAILDCPVGDAVLEIDGGELRTFPTELSLPGATPPFSLTIFSSLVPQSFLSEILRHLGYGHIAIDASGGAGQVSGPAVDDVLQRLQAHALQHQRFEPESLEILRSEVRAAHHRLGLPDLRLWPWPHRADRPYRMALSVRYDVDKAIVNMPMIHALEDRYGLRSTAYLRPLGLFYGRREIQRYARRSGLHELALHGEFVSTAEDRFGDEAAAAAGEKTLLSSMLDRPVVGVCMHGGELRTNTTPRTRDAIESAGFLYETMYRNRYYLPLHVPHDGGVRRALSIGQHFADITIPLTPRFSEDLSARFQEHFEAASAAAGVFVPVMHPLYHGVARYMRQPMNAWRMANFLPRFLITAARMRREQPYANQP